MEFSENLVAVRIVLGTLQSLRTGSFTLNSCWAKR
jgi:hypothetical protein